MNSRPVRAGAGTGLGSEVGFAEGHASGAEGGGRAGMCLRTQRDDRRFSQALPTSARHHGPQMPGFLLVSLPGSPCPLMGGWWGRRGGRKSQGRGAPALHSWVCHEPGQSQTFGDREASPLAGELGGGVLLLTLFAVFSLESSAPSCVGNVDRGAGTDKVSLAPQLL